MTATVADDAQEEAPTFRYQRRGRWLDHWEPENRAFWESGGKKTARKNLLFSVFPEHLGFNVWVIWTIVVTNMGNAGFVFMEGVGGKNPQAVSNALLLTSAPVLVGSALRVPYTFAIPRFGGRAFTAFSASMLLIP